MRIIIGAVFIVLLIALVWGGLLNGTKALTEANKGAEDE